MSSNAFAQEAEKKSDDSPITVKGSAFSRFEYRENYGLSPAVPDGSDFVRYRARLGLHTRPIEIKKNLKLHMDFVPQAGGIWHVGGDTLEDPSLGLHVGALVVNHPLVQVEVGRFEMAYGEHLLIGNVGWHHLGRAFDGARFKWRPIKGVWIDAFFTTLSEGLVGAPPQGDSYGAGDTYFTGIYSNLGPLISKDLSLDVYALSRLWPESELAADPADPASMAVTQKFAAELTLGARLKGKVSLLDYRLEADVQLGGRRAAGEDPADVLAYQADAEVGFNFKEAGNLRLGLEGFFASGDDAATPEAEGFNHLFPTAHKWLGLMDFVGARSNVMGGIFHSSIKPGPVKFVLDAHTFFRPEVPDGAESYLGTEIDFGIIYPIAKQLKLRGLYGHFIPEDSNADSLHFVEIEVRTDF